MIMVISVRMFTISTLLGKKLFQAINSCQLFYAAFTFKLDCSEIRKKRNLETMSWERKSKLNYFDN